MKKRLTLSLLISLVGTASADSFPVPPSTDAYLSASSALLEADYRIERPDTNGYYVERGEGDYFIVDNYKKPKCVFYLNYAEGGAIITSYTNIQEVNLYCD
jgi:hypothetical protein